MFWKTDVGCVLLVQLTLMLALGVLAGQMIDYCNMYDCGKRHIACHNDGEPGTKCPNLHFVSLVHQKNLILDLHNKMRNAVAGGQHKFRKVARMATMQWDDDLADMSYLKVMQCEHEEGKCFSTKQFKYPGQNTIFFSYDARDETLSIDYIVQNSLENFLNVYDMVSIYQLLRIPKHYDEDVMAQFVLAVVDKNAFIGCAASNSQRESDTQVMVVCTYAFEAVVGMAAVTETKVAASGCLTGKNPNYPNLCSVNEEYDFQSI